MDKLPPFALLLPIACGAMTPPSGAASTSSTGTTETTSSSSTSPTTTQSPTDAPSTTTESTTTTTDALTSSDTTLTGTQGPDLPVGPVECDVYAQDCPPGQKCAPFVEGGGGTWNATKCVDITGDGAPGDPCTAVGRGASGVDDCAFGSICWDVDRAQHGTCFALCLGSVEDPICPPNSSCLATAEGALNVCYPACDPLLGDCPKTEVCVPNNDDFICAPDASGPGGQVNDPCEFANACDPGLVCSNAAAASSVCDPGSQGCCQPFCKFPNSPCPNPDQQCIQWFDPMQPIPPGSDDIGVCAIPP